MEGFGANLVEVYSDTMRNCERVLIRSYKTRYVFVTLHFLRVDERQRLETGKAAQGWSQMSS